MKIARIRLKNSVESYGIVSEDGKKIITKKQIQEKTGVPIPPQIKEFMFFINSSNFYFTLIIYR